MTLIKLFEHFTHIDALCKKWGIKNYTINPDRTIDVAGDADLRKKGLKALPLKFGRVTGYFDCSENQLTTLEGAPKVVGSWFDSSHNQLTTLEGSPKELGGGFYCHHNKLTTLEGAPKEVGGGFLCGNNNLTTFEGAPREVGGNFHCDNNQLRTLEGAPKEVGHNFYCGGNPLPKEVLNFEDPKYILKWQDDYGIWQSGKLNQFRWQQMINDHDLG